MINLLPPVYKKEIKAAHINLTLARYVVALVGALLFLFAAIGLCYFYLLASQSQAEATQKDNEAKAANFTKTQEEATALRSQLTAAKTLLDSDIHYSKALLRLSALLPTGVSLPAILLESDSFNTPQTYVFYVTGESAAIDLQHSLSNSPYITNVSLGQLSTTSDLRYPYALEITMTINRSIANG